MPLDFNLIESGPRINTPFENLAQVLAVRNQQEAARGLADQRAAIADERRQKAELARQEAQAAAQFKALWSRTDPATGQPVMPTLEESAQIIGPKNAADVFKAIEEVRKQGWTNEREAAQGIASLVGGIEAWPAADRQTPYNTVRQSLITKGLIKPGDMPETYNPSWVAQKRREALTALQQFEQDKPKPLTQRDPTKDLIDSTGKVITPGTQEPPKLGTFEDFLGRYAATRRLKPEQLSAGDITKAKAQYEAAGRAPTQRDNEPLMSVMGKDGPIYVRRSQAEGMTPASNREQGRPVTSGDAGRIAELDTSLDDLAVLRQQLGTTGAASKVGAMLPNVVTEYTGWGMDAKARQGTIDRVKQVIGKALEGGVLRKEDEYKYTKILPTIGDPPSVAKSKLEELDKAIALRRERELDAREDAGYDVSKFRARQPKTGTPDAAAKAAELIKKYGGG